MSLRRGRQYYRSYPCFRLGISIHASTRGTTAFVASCFPTAKFQSTSPRGGRPLNLLFCGLSRKFQSTSPRGGRPGNRIDSEESKQFQSTSPRGGRRFLPQFQRWTDTISIHVPTRGTTNPRHTRLSPHVISIHVPTRGTTPPNPPQPPFIIIFQSTSPRGGRPAINPYFDHFHFISIHVPTRGTTSFMVSNPLAASISIHVPTRGTTIPILTH